jgi:AraC-like DNA-binding protein
MSANDAAAPLVVAYTPRERTRAWVKRHASKRPGRLALPRTVGEFAGTFRRELVDAAIVDVGAATGSDEAAALALEYPSIAFVAITSFRPSDAPAVARCAELAFADVLVEGVDEGVARELLASRGYSGRFASVLDTPPPSLRLASPLHLATWRFILARGGRPIRTSALASAMGLTREHLSRSFGTGGAPTLKRLIDLVRLLSAAELAKNPGYDVADVARVLGFSSSAHLSLTAQRLICRRASSLAAMRGVDVVDRFTQEQVALDGPAYRNRGAGIPRRGRGRR